MKRYLVSYSPSINDYIMCCIDEGNLGYEIKMKQYIKARGSDEIIKSVSFEEYEKIMNSFEIKHIIGSRLK